jgi:hypothetical protein
VILIAPKKRHIKTFKSLLNTRDHFLNTEYEIIEWHDTKLKDKLIILLRPKITFYTTPWSWFLPLVLQNQFNINSINIYSPYQINIFATLSTQYKNIFFRYLHLNFLEYKYSLEIFNSVVFEKRTRKVVSRHPALEVVSSIADRELLNKKYDTKLSILWTPHHTIHAEGISSFFKFKDFFLELSNGNAEFQVIFRPHPALKDRLIENGFEELYQKYYNAIQISPNGHLDQGNYLNAFIKSDLCINDSESFTVLYRETLKPLAITFNPKIDSLIPEVVSVIETIPIVNNENELREFLKKCLESRGNFKVSKPNIQKNNEVSISRLMYEELLMELDRNNLIRN